MHSMNVKHIVFFLNRNQIMESPHTHHSQLLSELMYPCKTEQHNVSINGNQCVSVGSRGLMDRALDLKPEVTKGCGFESRLWQEVHD